MTAVTLDTDYFVKDALTSNSVKMVVISTDSATAVLNDTIAITLASYGISPQGPIGVIGWDHYTENSVTVQAQPTTAVAAGVLTITIGGTATTGTSRHFLLFGSSVDNP